MYVWGPWRYYLGTLVTKRPFKSQALETGIESRKDPESIWKVSSGGKKIKRERKHNHKAWLVREKK